MVRPPFTPPPAIHMVKPLGLWSRPSPFSLIGVRPNSPPHTTSVSSRRPRSFKSRSRPATGAVVLFDVVVGVPFAAGAAVELDEAHPALDETPRQKAHLAVLRGFLF